MIKSLNNWANLENADLLSFLFKLNKPDLKTSS